MNKRLNGIKLQFIIQLLLTLFKRMYTKGKLFTTSSWLIINRTRVYVEGKLQYNQYEKDGVKKTSSQIVVDRNGNIVVLSPKKDQEWI